MFGIQFLSMQFFDDFTDYESLKTNFSNNTRPCISPVVRVRLAITFCEDMRYMGPFVAFKNIVVRMCLTGESKWLTY